MNNKVIFIIVDALSFRASERMGYMMHLAEQKKAYLNWLGKMDLKLQRQLIIG
jgi:predicted AlkP superfamily pyrophosphatase or phosphodiesterase